jgi:hypothetical protein
MMTLVFENGYDKGVRGKNGKKGADLQALNQKPHPLTCMCTNPSTLSLFLLTSAHL